VRVCGPGVFVGEEDGWSGEDVGVDFVAEFGGRQRKGKGV